MDSVVKDQAVKKKIAVGLSGGVDSAVSALLLKKAGYEVTGVFLYCWPPTSEYLDKNRTIDEVEKEKLRSEWIAKNGCRADEDRSWSLKTAMELGISWKNLDLSDEYYERVMTYFYKEYEEGRTPNPDVMCNSEIKFGLFLDWALENGFDAVATGHYARLTSSNLSSERYLQIPRDKKKDQTYFLWKIPKERLSKIIFPLSEFTKDEVREIAKTAKLSVFDKKDSQGICFVGNVDMREFLARRLRQKIGHVINTKGDVMGEHDGVWFYTIGQRGGWRMNPKMQKEQMKDGKTQTWYVIHKSAQNNTLTVSSKVDLGKSKFEITHINVLVKSKDWWKQNLRVRIRNLGQLSGCELMPQENGFEVYTHNQLDGIAPGQSAVFYGEDERVVAGGLII